MRIQFLLIVLSVSLLSACGPDTVMLPTDFIWRMNNKTEKTLIIKGSVLTRYPIARYSGILLPATAGTLSTLPAENGKSITTWK